MSIDQLRQTGFEYFLRPGESAKTDKLLKALTTIGSHTGPIDLLVYPAGAGDAVHLAYAKNLLLYDVAPFMYLNNKNDLPSKVSKEIQKILFLYFSRGFEDFTEAGAKEAVVTIVASLYLLGADLREVKYFASGDLQGVQFAGMDGPRYVFYHKARLNGVDDSELINDDIQTISNITKVDRRGLLVKGDYLSRARGSLDKSDFQAFIVSDPHVKVPQQSFSKNPINWSEIYLNDNLHPEGNVAFGYCGAQNPLRIGLTQ